MQGNFNLENVTREIYNVNNNKRGYGLPQRSTSTYARISPCHLQNIFIVDMKKSSNSSIEDDIVAPFRKIQFESTISKENQGNDKKNSNIS